MDLVAKRKQLEEMKEKTLANLHAIAGQLALVEELLSEAPPAPTPGSNGSPSE